MIVVNGFTVVRLPTFCGGPFYTHTPSIDGKIYRGLDRQAWSLPDEDSFGIQQKAAQIKNSLKTGVFYNYNLNFTENYELAANFQRLVPSKMEVLAVHCEDLFQIGSSLFELDTQLLDYEIIVVGEWSLHRSGPFLHREGFEAVIPLLNEHGLFGNQEDCNVLKSEYKRLMDAGAVEPIAVNTPIITCQIYKT